MSHISFVNFDTEVAFGSGRPDDDMILRDERKQTTQTMQNTDGLQLKVTESIGSHIGITTHA